MTNWQSMYFIKSDPPSYLINHKGPQVAFNWMNELRRVPSKKDVNINVPNIKRELLLTY
jgi:hypothetical protein